MKLGYTRSAFVAALAASCLLTIPATAQSAAGPQITQTINPTQLTVLAGNTRPEAISANDRGRVADSFAMENMQLQLRRPIALEQAFEGTIDAMYVRSSPTFHQWMTAAQIGAQFGPNEQDVQTVTHWLTSFPLPLEHNQQWQRLP